MAGQFGIKVVAEGVETQAQADALRGMGCGECQGFLFGRPVPAAAHRSGPVLARVIVLPQPA